MLNSPSEVNTSSRPVAEADSAQPAASQLLLLYEEDEAVRKSLQAALQAAGYKLAVVTDPQQVLAAIKTDSPALLLLDMNFANADNWDLLERLITPVPLLPMILITGLSDPFLAALAAGVGALLEKPLDVPGLLGAVERVLNDSHAERQRVFLGLAASLPPVPSPGATYLEWMPRYVPTASSEAK